MDELTELQERGLHLIDRYIKEHGQAPTRRELAEQFGLLPHRTTDYVSIDLQRI